MDWKRFYADELAGAGGRAAALDALARHARGDAAIESALRAGGIASFPHVTIHASADPIARVVQSILETGAKRVVALGVLHGGTRAGAVVGRGPVHTPFGDIDDGPAPPLDHLIRHDDEALRAEFSLDLFLALLAAAAPQRGVPAPPVTRVFVSATRGAEGGFDTAASVAAAVRAIADAGTACVATGDLAHVGHGYTPDAEVAAMPSEAGVLAAGLRAQIDAMHEAALARCDFAGAWAIGSRLRSDQRHLLPVVAHLLGPGATAELLSFGLADYARINGRPSPCVVAAALVAFRPAPQPSIS